jgi:UDP-2,3-diacylglucosamine hydrolase
MASDDSDRLILGGRIYLVSDVHLHPAQPEVFLAFCRFLDEVVRGARALYVLGDLFDFWIGPRQLRIPGFSEIFSRTRRLREEGTEVFFLAGNRDFALDGPFATAQGLRVLGDRAEAVFGEKRVLMTHGDLLCTRDRAYLRMRRWIRSRVARRIMDRLPLGLLLRLTRGLRAASGREIERKAGYVLEPDYRLAKEWVADGFDALVFGHVHRGERLEIDLGDRSAEIFVLGSWEDGPNYVEWSGEGLALRRYLPANSVD